VGKRLRLSLAVLSFSLLTMAAASASAVGKVVVIPFQGPPIPVVQRALYVCQRVVTSAIPPAYNLVPPADVAKAMAGDRLVNPGDYASMAGRVEGTAIIEGLITVEQRRRWRLRVTVRRANTGAPVGTVTWSGIGSRPLISNLQRNANQWVSSLLQRTGGPTAEPAGGAVAADEGGSDDEESPSLSASASSGGRRRNGPSMWAFSLGPHVVSRAFVFTDNLAGLPGYNLPGAPALAAEVEFFPAAHTNTVARNLGFAAFYETSIGAKTTTNDGSSGATLSRAYRVGARYRIPVASSAVLLGADYAQHYFNLQVDSALPPNVNYSAVRPSLTGRVAMGSKLTLSLTAAYLHILTVGQLASQDQWPNMTSLGAEASAMLSYQLDNDLELGVGADLRHYAHAMNVQQGEPMNRLVGGALDEHFGATMLLTYRLR